MLNRTLSHYRIVERLNASAMGEVYKAEDLKLQRTVALKFLSPSLLSEARAAAAVNHPNIAAVYGIEQAEDLSFIVMEYVEGETLAERIKRKPLEIVEAIDISMRIADALRTMHEKGFIHCDVKSANVMAARDGSVKMLDFGMAVRADGNGEAGIIAGTLGYMSPEQARGERLDQRTDLFSFGATLYEMLTGRTPFEGESAAAALDATINDEPVSIGKFRDDVPLELESIVRRTLEKRREDRYRSAEELLSDLKKLRSRIEPGAVRKEPLQDASQTAGAAFRGLLPFQEADRDRFYGRETETAILFDMIAHEEFRFGALFGESGCGKTSLLRAGLLPKLWEEGFVPLYCRSYKDLVAAVVEECRKQSSVERRDGERPADYLRRAAEESDAKLVVVCDQFEEFFICFKSETEREPFIDFVIDCHQINSPSVKFLFSIRSDFLYLINSEFSPRIPDPLMSSKLYNLRCFDEQRAEEVIEKSALRSGLPFESGLSRTVARDLAEGGTVLPSELQIVGERLQNKRIYKSSDYRRAGGREALVHGFLEDVIEASGEREIAHLLLRCLISEENTRIALSAEGIAQRVQRSRRRTDRVLKLFVQSRLVREIQEDEPWRYELMHEYLIEKINRITGRVMDAVQRANRDFRQFLSSYSADKKTRIPLGKLWTIRRYSDLKRGERERELLKKSLVSGLLKTSAVMLSISIVAAVIAAVLSVSEDWKELRLSDGHTAGVRRVVFSPDGLRLVSVGEDAKVMVWDFARRERLAVFTDHTRQINAAAFSPDGKWFATGSDDGTLIVWDATRLEKAKVLHHKNPIFNVGFSPDGQMLFSTPQSPMDPSGKFDEPITLWETGRWEKIRELYYVLQTANSFFSLDGSQLIEPGGRVWDLNMGKQLTDTIDKKNQAASSYGSAISPDGAQMVCADSNGTVHFLDLTLREFRSYREHRDNGRAVAYSPDGRMVATGAENIILWDAATFKELKRFDYTSAVWSLAFAPDGRQLVSAHSDGAILLWDVEQSKRIASFNEHTGPARAVSFSPDGKRLASAGADLSVIVWNAETGRKEAVLVGQHIAPLTSAAFSPDGKSIASSDSYGMVIYWDIVERQPRWKHKHPEQLVRCLTISPDGRYVAAGVEAHESSGGSPIFHFDASIYSLSFSADGSVLAGVTGRDLYLWNLEERRLLEKLPFNTADVVRVAVSPDGKWLVTGEDGGALRLWSIEPLREVALLGSHKGRVKSVVFSSDGLRVASASDDRTIALWDIGKRRLVTQIGSHASPALGLAFSPDGKKLASAESDGSVRVYTRNRSIWGYRLD